MQSELIEIQRKLHTTIVFITHDLDEAINVGDRIILMKDGEIVQTGTAEQILTNPASEYVERFVEDVNAGDVLTARAAMNKPRTVAHANDGPRTVLRKMQAENRSTIFSIDSAGRLEGLIRVERASQLVSEGDTDHDALIERDVKTASPDTPLHDLVPMMAANRDPIAVVDDNRTLVGVVMIGALLASLAGHPSGQPSGHDSHDQAANSSPSHPEDTARPKDLQP